MYFLQPRHLIKLSSTSTLWFCGPHIHLSFSKAGLSPAVTWAFRLPEALAIVSRCSPHSDGVMQVFVAVKWLQDKHHCCSPNISVFWGRRHSRRLAQQLPPSRRSGRHVVAWPHKLNSFPSGYKNTSYGKCFEMTCDEEHHKHTFSSGVLNATIYLLQNPCSKTAKLKTK